MTARTFKLLLLVLVFSGAISRGSDLCPETLAFLHKHFPDSLINQLVAADRAWRKKEVEAGGYYSPRSTEEAQAQIAVEAFRAIRNIAQMHRDNEVLAKDEPELAGEAAAENAKLEAHFAQLAPDLKNRMLARLDPEPGPNTRLIVELNADGHGYDAEIFIRDLADQYERLAAANGVSVELLYDKPGNQAGGSGVGKTSITLALKGKNAYRLFRNEGGVHVRVGPSLTMSGKKDDRTYTTPVKVTVHTELTDVQAKEIPESEFEITTTRGTGPGGQNKNKVESAVRVKHISTGVTVFIQNERDQLQNKRVALLVARARVAQARNTQQHANALEARRSQLGAGTTGERVRTYDYNRNQVSDSRTGTRFQLGAFFSGRLPAEYHSELDDYRLMELAEAAPAVEP